MTGVVYTTAGALNLTFIVNSGPVTAGYSLSELPIMMLYSKPSYELRLESTFKIPLAVSTVKALILPLFTENSILPQIEARVTV